MNNIPENFDDELEREFQNILNKPAEPVEVNKPNWKEIVEQGNKEFEADLNILNADNKKVKQVKKYFQTQNHSSKLVGKIEKRFQKYEPKIRMLDDKIKYRQNRLIELKFDNHLKYKKDKIDSITNELSKYLSDKGVQGEMLNTIFYNGFGWRSGKFGEIGEDIESFDYENIYAEEGGQLEQDKYDKFLIYLIVKPKAEGGNDLNNDCLFNCLEFYLNDRNPWANGGTLKKYLGLQRNAKIPISLIPKIEEKLKSFQINIIGDYTYSSQVKSNKVISLILEDEHYSVNRNIDNSKIKNLKVHYKEKQIMLYDKRTFQGYDGKELIQIDKIKIPEFEKTTGYKYIFIPRVLEYNHLSIQEEYLEWVKTADILKKETNGIINLYKTGDIKSTALNLFDRFTKYIFNPEKISQDEFIWLRNSTTGAVIFADEYQGEGYKFDIKSMYPSIYMSYGKIPVKRGEFKTITQNELNSQEIFNYGIYRCKVQKSNDRNTDKLFRFNNKNYYPHISLEHAKSLNLKIEMIEDNKPNFLSYSRDKLIGFNEVFTEYTNYLFKLKEKKVPKAKLLLNILWGALTEIKKHSYATQKNKQIKINDEERIVNIYTGKDDDDIIIKTINYNDIYVSNFGRLQTFILARGRFNISKIMQPIKDKVVRCNTDGFISMTNEGLKLGNKIGELVFEGYCNDCQVINCNKILGEFIVQ